MRLKREIRSMQSQHHLLIQQGPLNARAPAIHHRLYVGAALLFCRPSGNTCSCRRFSAIGVGGARRNRHSVLHKFAIAWLAAAINNLMHNNRPDKHAEKSADKDGNKVKMRTEKAYLPLRRNRPCWQYRPRSRRLQSSKYNHRP
jgi:hypothetical protein